MRKKLLLLVFCYLGIFFVSAQEIFNGKVVGTDSLEIPGVNVVQKDNITNGTFTNLDGKWELKLPSGSSLIELSGVGLQNVVVAAKDASFVVMQEDDQLLGEVVVTALGIKRQERALSYNVQKINQDALTKVKDVNFVNSLDGKVAGVNIQRGATGVGGATKVIMRGAKSISGTNNVLYVVDGVPLGNKSHATDGNPFVASGGGGGEGISDLNPEDIESISVLTGPSAAALYGASAANGVILINTRKGKEGKLQLRVSSNTELLRTFVTPKFQDRYGHMIGEEVSWGDKITPAHNNKNSYHPYDFLQIGYATTNAINASMGNKTNQTFLSFASTNSEGLMPSNEYYRYNFSFRNTVNALNNRLHADISASYILQGNQNMFSQGGYGNPLLTLYLFPRGDNFDDIKAFERFNPSRNISEQYWPYGGKIGAFTSENPYWIINREIRTSQRSRYMFQGSLKYDITNWLNVAGRVRIDNTSRVDQTKLYASTTETLAPGTKGTYTKHVEDYKQVYADFMINIDKTLGSFHLTANIGTSYEDHNTQGTGIGGRLNLIPNLFSAPNLVVNQQGSSENVYRTRNLAVFASTELGFKDMLFLTLTGRNDWASQLVNSKEPSIFYPSVGLSWLASEVLPKSQIMNYLKLRVSYTEVGSPITFTGLTPGTLTYAIKGGNIEPISAYPYPDFKAERTRSFEFGLNTKLLDRKLSLDVTLYKSNTYNQTFFTPLPSSSGYSGFYVQAGDVENKGIELALGCNLDFGKESVVNLSSVVTFSSNINKIVDLVGEQTNPVTGETFSLDKLNDNLREGGSMGDITARGVLKRNEKGELLENSDGSRFEIDKSQLILMGNSEPDFTIGWKTDLACGGFHFGVLVKGRFGGIVQSHTQSYLNTYGVSEESAKARDNGGVLVDGKRYDARKYYESIDGVMSYYTYDATNIRLQELSIGYTIGGEVFKNYIKSLTISLIGRNLYMFYNKAPYDPEVSANTTSFSYRSDFFMMPSITSYGIGLKLKF